MKLLAFSLLDQKTGMFNVPFFMSHRGQAIRACMDLAADRSTTVARHPADFMLCLIGEFDDQTGQFFNLRGEVEHLGTVASFAGAVQQQLPLIDGESS